MLNLFKGVSYKGRSIWKGLNLYIFSKSYFYKTSNKILKKFYVLSQYDVGLTYKIYNGRLFKISPIGYKSIGCKFGQFIVTKKMGYSIHILKDRKNIK